MKSFTMHDSHAEPIVLPRKEERWQRYYQNDGDGVCGLFYDDQGGDYGYVKQTFTLAQINPHIIDQCVPRACLYKRIRGNFK